MIIVKFGKYFLHYSLSEKHCFRIHLELVAISVDSSHLAVIQINDLPMSSDKGCLLLLQIFGVDTGMYVFLFSGHN